MLPFETGIMFSKTFPNKSTDFRVVLSRLTEVQTRGTNKNFCLKKFHNKEDYRRTIHNQYAIFGISYGSW